MSNLTLPFKKRAICCQTCTNFPAQRDGKKFFAWQTSKQAPKHRDVQASQGKRTRHGTALLSISDTLDCQGRWCRRAHFRCPNTPFFAVPAQPTQGRHVNFSCLQDEPVLTKARHCLPCSDARPGLRGTCRADRNPTSRNPTSPNQSAQRRIETRRLKSAQVGATRIPRSGQNSSDMLLGQDLEHVRQKYVLKGIFRPLGAENVLTGHVHCHKIRLSAYI